MDVAALIVSTFAVAFTVVSLVYTRRATQVSEAADRRARQPRLSLTPEYTSEEDARQVFYGLRNDGPQDLDSVNVFRPRLSDGITYPLARVGGDWADDEAALGSLALTQEVRFTFACGPASPWPDFQMRIVVRAGRDS